MANLTREQRAAREAEAAARGNPAADDDEGDERLVRNAGDDTRGDRGFEQTHIRAEPLGDEEFEQMMAEEFEQSALPNPPPLPGWHQVWLTSTSQYDSIQKRQRLGYQPVRTAEHEGFDPSNGQSLERFAGCITCNEMVLFKIEETRYQALMRHFHHKKPLLEEEGIVSQLRAAGRDDKGRQVAKLEGSDVDQMESEVEKAKRLNPVFR